MKAVLQPFLFSILLSLACVLQVFQSFSQKNDSILLPRNTISIEIFGNSIIGSLNYERLLPVTKKLYISGRAGVGIYYVNGQFPVSFPLLISIIYQAGKVFSLESGAGTTIYLWENHHSNPKRVPKPVLTGFLGFRLQNPGKGFCFKMGVTPIYDAWPVNNDILITFLPLVGWTFGYSF